MTGASAPIDFGDGAGMNLLDLQSGAWSPALLAATAPGLAQKLLPAVPSATPVGSYRVPVKDDTDTSGPRGS